jgi:hypothetical protein
MNPDIELIINGLLGTLLGCAGLILFIVIINYNKDNLSIKLVKFLLIIISIIAIGGVIASILLLNS